MRLLFKTRTISHSLTGELVMGFARDSLYNSARLTHRMAVHKPSVPTSHPMNRRNQSDTEA